MNLNYIGHNQWDGKNFENFYKRVISKKWDKIILFCQNEWEWHMHDPRVLKMLINHCKNINQTIHVITGSHHKMYPDISPELTEVVDVFWWDTYWLGKTYHALIHTRQARSINPYDMIDYKYRFVSMNHRPHTHRLFLIDLLAKYDLINTNAVSVHQENTINYKWKYFDFKRILLEPEFVEDRQQHRLPEQYYLSFAQLISEASGNIIMLSEKTAIPLIVGKPFLVAAQMYFHKFLQDLGFQLYDEIFDYAFDSEPDQEKRYEMLIENFKKLQSVPLTELPNLHKKIANKIDFNKRKAREIIFDLNRYPKIALEVIEYNKKTGVEIDSNLLNNFYQLEMCKDVDF